MSAAGVAAAPAGDPRAGPAGNPRAEVDAARRADPHAEVDAARPGSAGDPRAEVDADRRRQRWLWGATAGGLLLLVSIFSGGLFLYAVLVTGGLVAVAAGWSALSLRDLEVARWLGAAEIARGSAVEARLIVRNRKSLPAPWLVWRERIETGLDAEGPLAACRSLGAGAEHKLAYRLHASRRGLYRVGPAVIEASGPFGLVRRYLVDRETRFLTVLPRTVEIGRGWPLGHRPIHEVPRRRSLFEDPARFLGLREYRRGDSLRRIHWRATARSGRLQVKLFEPAVLDGCLLAIDMARGVYRRGEDEELAVTAAASLAEFVLAGGQTVGVVSNGADAAERYPEDWTGGTFRRPGDALDAAGSRPDDWRGGTFRRLGDALDAAGSRRELRARAPLELLPARGRWQRDRVRTLLARLVPAAGLPLARLLRAELPRLPRALVLMIVTPVLDPELGETTAALKRAGLEVAVVWIRGAEPVDDVVDRGGGDDEDDGKTETSDVAMSEAMALLEGVPVYAIRDDGDLEALAGRRL